MYYAIITAKNAVEDSELLNLGLTIKIDKQLLYKAYLFR